MSSPSQRYSNFKLSIIAPMFNEEAVIVAFIEATLTVLTQYFTDYELLLIDDGSTDKTVSLCLPYIRANPCIRLISFSRNYGHEMASTAGLDYASGDYMVLMDADLQHPPEVIPKLVHKACEGFDVVCASRVNREEESWFKQLGARLFYRLSRKMTGFNLQSDTGNFRLLHRRVVDSLKRMKESNRHLIMMFAYIGYQTAYVDYYCAPRAAGVSKYNTRKLMNLSLDSIIGFSSRPLRGMACFSVCISIVMMLYAGFILIEKFSSHQQLADGIASIIFLISGLFSILFLFLAVLSEYISRILIETKKRPLYNVKQDITHQSLTDES